MDAILDFGIAVILFLQSMGAWLAPIMTGFSFLGTQEFYLFIAPALYWCVDQTLGLRVGLALMISGVVNNTFKLAFQGIRPYWYDERVIAYSSEISFGIPSGHAQNAVTTWGTLAAGLKRKWATIIALLLMFFIGVSRLYLGMHFVHDVIAGWLIGALLLWAILALEDRVTHWLARFRPAEQILIVFGVSLALILPWAVIRLWNWDYQVPVEWITMAARAAPEAEPIDPLNLEYVLSSAGVFFGLAAGAIFLRRYGGLDAGGPTSQRLLRFLVGLAGILIIWYGLGAVLPRNDDLLSYTLYYLRYCTVGLWVSCLAPLIFFRLGLAQPKNPIHAA